MLVSKVKTADIEYVIKYYEERRPAHCGFMTGEGAREELDNLLAIANTPAQIIADNYDKQIDNIMCWFDFERVEKAMAALDWSWVGSDNATPHIGEIRTKALKLLRGVADDLRKGREVYRTGTGGFMITHREGILELTFELDSWEYVGDDN